MLSPLSRADGHGQLTGVVPFDHPPSLALAIVTVGPAVRLRALLEIMRPHVDEIVVGVDQDLSPQAFDACAGIADRCLALDLGEAVGPGALAWVHHHCTADWILDLDVDEVPGAGLLASLRAVVADRRPAALCLETRWLYPDPNTYIVSPPWRGDMRPRILRNLPGIWRFASRHRTHLEVAGELRYVDLPIYHLGLVVASKDDRLRQARLSQQQRPDLSDQGFPGSSIYLPDAIGDLLETRSVATADRALVDALIAPVVAPVTSGGAGPDGHGSSAMIDQFDDREGPLEPGDYRAALDVLQPPTTVPAGAQRRYLVRVRHEGLTRWPAGEHQAPLIRLGYRWVEEASDQVAMEGRWLLSESVMAGETTLQLVSVQTPPRPGRHRLEIDMVHEHVRWFGHPFTLQVEVEGDDRAALRAASPLADDAAELQILERQLAKVEEDLAVERQLRTTLQGRLAQRLAASLDRLRRRGS